MRSIERKLRNEALRNLVTPALGLKFNVEFTEDSSIQAKIYALGFKYGEGIEKQKYREMLCLALKNTASLFIGTNSKIPGGLEYIFDTLVIRDITYKIFKDREELEARLLFLKDGKEVLVRGGLEC